MLSVDSLCLQVFQCIYSEDPETTEQLLTGDSFSALDSLQRERVVETLIDRSIYLNFPQGVQLGLRYVESGWTLKGQATPGENMLFLAAEWGRVNAVRGLLGVLDPMQCNVDGRQPLGVAAICGHVECVKLLIPHSNPLHEDHEGDTPLRLAVEAREWACADALAPFSDPAQALNAVENAEGQMPAWAAKLERDALVEALQSRASPLRKPSFEAPEGIGALCAEALGSECSLVQPHRPRKKRLAL